ncbi:MAG: hypothetical protein HFJ80_05305 [Clostridiales bacterium]|nr:hypothetical protein [Clostridiales bacterium]
MGLFRKTKIVYPDIDYDKLADAIMTAHERLRAREQKKERESLKKDSTFGLMRLILRFYFAVGILIFGAFFAACLWIMFQNAMTLWEYFVAVLLAATLFFSAGYCVLLLRDMRKVWDRQYLSSLFSSIVALTALIVSILSLCHSWGYL